MKSKAKHIIKKGETKMKKILSLLLTLVLVFALAACASVSDGAAGSTASGATEGASGEQSASTAATDPDEGQNEIADLSENYASITDAVTALVATLTEDRLSAALPAEYASGVYEIKEAGAYYFSGALTEPITVAKNAGDVHVYLENATLSVENAAAISSKKGARLTITLIGDNSLSNSGETAKHILDSKENLVINGTGTLTIVSTKSAISCDGTLIGLGGAVTVTAEKHAVTADSIYLDGFSLNVLSCGKDVLHAESDYDEVESAPAFDYGKGYVYIKDATITTATVLGDGIQADSFVYVKDGTFTLNTTPTWNDAYVATANREKGMYNRSTHQKVSRDSVRAGSTYAVLEESVKGIRVGEIDYYLSTDAEQENELNVVSDKYAIVIEGGTFNINTVDDAIHDNSGSVLISGGTLTINTSDDGIHADTNLKIAGDAVINIETSYEGIEAETIDIAGGNTTIFALDDGVNATNSNLTESQQKTVCQINISGGRLDVTVNPNGDRDGIDSNGGIKITGGVLITRGPNSQMASPMDSANTVSITGGTVIVIGCAPGSGGRMSGGRGGPGGPGGEGSWSVSGSMVKTQSSSKGLSTGLHTVTVGTSTITYTNAYTYSGYTTVYAASSATVN